MRTNNHGLFVIMLIWVGVFAAFSSAWAAIPKNGAFASLSSKAQTSGTVRVIVKLNSSDSVSYSSVQSNVINTLNVNKDVLINNVKNFRYIPYTAMEVNVAGLASLASNQSISSIEEDVVTPPVLAESVPLIGATTVFATGITGTGYAVAILDTGMESSHSFLSGKVVSQACYSSQGADTTSVCPNGQTSQTGTGSGEPCTFSGCNHGTHVAGIAAGTSRSRTGVAKGSNIIAIQVFSKVSNAGMCSLRSAPCALSFSSDQILALERVLELKSTFNIAAVNMSLGGGQYTANCDTFSIKSIIDQLQTAGIATVVSSGNDGYVNAMSFPACVSSAISVGSTAKSDVISSFSNSASFISILAPGSSIISFVPGNAFSAFSGTSMAAPHTAGAFALMKQQRPGASVSGLLSEMQNSGVPIFDTRSEGNGLRSRMFCLCSRRLFLEFL